jgi:hypothetical protein
LNKTTIDKFVNSDLPLPIYDYSTLDFVFPEKTNKRIAGVYFLLSAKTNKIIYVGRSKNLYYRIREHLRGNSHLHDYYSGFNLFSFIPLSQKDFDDHGKTLELKFIWKYRPICNRNYEGFYKTREMVQYDRHSERLHQLFRDHMKDMNTKEYRAYKKKILTYILP